MNTSSMTTDSLDSNLSHRNLTIVADENIPLVREFFSTLGEVHTVHGRSITAEHVKHADILLVRSVTVVDETLLEGSRVRFVGTCTIGVDHLDLNYLESKGIAYSSAPGCNANSVVEYVFSALASVRPDWLSKTFGVVGCGNVGGALYKRLKALGLTVSYYDPLINVSSDPSSSDGLPCNKDRVSLQQVLSADIVCLHAPLTREGRFPSWHMISESQLQALSSGALLLNAGRGAVIDNDALLAFMKQRSDVDVVLDVWEGEPMINHELLPLVTYATPHIAGYSFDGKVEGTSMIYRAVCERFNKPLMTGSSDHIEADPVDPIVMDGVDIQLSLNQAILAGYDVRQDDVAMRNALGAVSSDHESGVAFDALRKNYPIRREFFNRPVSSASSNSAQLFAMLKVLGFTVV